jgi:hypothetical protein
VTIDHRRSEERELLLRLATAPGPGNGIFLDNMVGKRFSPRYTAERRSASVRRSTSPSQMLPSQASAIWAGSPEAR